MMAVSDLQITLWMICPSEVRMLGIGFTLRCLAWWSFVISRKLIFQFLELREKQDKREKPVSDSSAF
jgi:hypothetical protein